MKHLLLTLVIVIMLPVISVATPIYPDPPDTISGGGFLPFSGELAFQFNTPIEVIIENVWNPDNVFDLMLVGYTEESTFIFSSYLGINKYEWDPDFINDNMAATPIPGAILLLGTGLVGLAGFRRKINQ